jgi:sugar lactone lactonase YvrE
VLYYHALTGYNLYAIPTEALNGTASDVEAAVNLVAKTPAPDGMIINGSGHLFLADLEHNKIMQMKLPNGPLTVFAEGADLKWVDTFSILGNDLYFTTSRINEAQGDISGLSFCIYKKAMH